MAKLDFDRLLGKDQVALNTIRLENVDRQTNTSKFYEIHVEQDFTNLDQPYRVVVYYGRIGSQNPRKEVKYQSQNDRLCSAYAEQLKNQKLKAKGYSLVR